MFGGIVMPEMNTTIKNIKLLNGANYEKASLYIEQLLREQSEDGTSEVSDDSIMHVVDMFAEKHEEAFKALAK